MSKLTEVFKDAMRLRQIFFIQKTVRQQEVPLLYREPGILTGYRLCGKSWLYYTGSIFQLHNETVNIWTHLIACIFLMFKLRDIVITSHFTDCDALPLAAFCACVLTSSFLSAFAHTFLSKSPLCHYLCLQLDYAGVGIYGFGKCILLFYISSPVNVFERISWMYLPFNVCLAWIVMTGGCIAKLFYRRPYPFRRKMLQLGCGGLHAALGGTPLTLRLIYCLQDEYCDISSVSHHLVWMVTMLLSIFFFSSHLPEKKFPGKFDYIFQGHNIFHVLISYTSYLQIQAANQDVNNSDGKTWSCHPVSGWFLWASIMSYCVGCVFIMNLLKNTVKKRIENDEKLQD